MSDSPIRRELTHDEAMAALRSDAQRLSHGGAGSITTGWKLAIAQRPDLAAVCGVDAQSGLLGGIEALPKFTPAPARGR